ncbi:hypothetical protein V6S67_08045 [Arthrobacter sp. Soc17.1.1.1]|uniref:hypothetical protein n=1 Tax=Arthrobacter sp. Soc17.1.1.1 TaxID=3121277 RepID=UPI002FE4C97A
MTTETFTDRHEKLVTIEKVTHHGDGATLKMSDGWTMLSPVDSYHYAEGRQVVREMYGFNWIGGLRLPDSDSWIFHRSDEHFAQADADRRAKWDQEKRERLAENREDWQKREDALPEWLRSRLQRFHAAGGEEFELEGWGYELAICEIAVIYARNGGVDDDEINQYGRVHGTSGNQHDCAKALAAHQDEAARMPAGLSPLTGSADYSDPEPLRSALAKLKARDEELTEVEHEDLTKALDPFLSKFAELITSLESTVEGAVEAIDWTDLVALVIEDAGTDELLPLRPFGDITSDEVDAWQLDHTARILEERHLSAALPKMLRRFADRLDPAGAELRSEGTRLRKEGAQ